jgi:hypothetical protein
MRKVSVVAGENPGMEAVEIKIRWGARCGAVAATLRKLFRRLKKGTVIQHAVLTIDTPENHNDSWAADILLEGVRLATPHEIGNLRFTSGTSRAQKV